MSQSLPLSASRYVILIQCLFNNCISFNFTKYSFLPAGFSTFSGGVSAQGIIATVGTDVTLACNYNAKYYGKLSTCWGRGPIPNSGCNNVVIRSDGTSVTSRLSERYLFMGDLSAGDVSLTIRQVEEGDSGMYGCRVDIPGWFNDHKHEQTLTVMAGETHWDEL